MINKTFRYTALFLGLVFIAFAVLQYNDPDPHLWIPVYLFAAIMSIVISFKKIKLSVLVISMVFYIIGAIYMWPSSYEGILLDMGYKTEIEEARESLGLLICGLAMGFYILVYYKKE